MNHRYMLFRESNLGVKFFLNLLQILQTIMQSIAPMTYFNWFVGSCKTLDFQNDEVVRVECDYLKHFIHVPGKTLFQWKPLNTRVKEFVFEAFLREVGQSKNSSKLAPNYRKINKCEHFLISNNLITKACGRIVPYDGENSLYCQGNYNNTQGKHRYKENQVPRQVNGCMTHSRTTCLT